MRCDNGFLATTDFLRRIVQGPHITSGEGTHAIEIVFFHPQSQGESLG